MENIFLNPGELYFSTVPCNISTILGSCIAVCLFDQVKKSGGMCHYYLPYATGNYPNRSTNSYAEHAIRNLLREFKKNGSCPNHIVAKIVGGGKVINVNTHNMNIGELNIKKAYEILHIYEIPIIGKVVGGNSGKKIQMNSSTGEIKWCDIKISTSKDTNQRIRVLIVEDSETVRKIIRKIIELDNELEVVAEAEDGIDAISKIAKSRPDVITLDMNMPNMGGLEFLKINRDKYKIPTIMISALNYEDSGPILESLQLGAFDYIKKPSVAEINIVSSEVIEKLKLAHISTSMHFKRESHKKERINLLPVTTDCISSYIVAIGASTGGTEAIYEVLTHLPSRIPSIIITLHIPPGFSKAYAERLNAACAFQVKEAEDNDLITPNCVYIAPGDRHMKVIQYGELLKVKITTDPPVNQFRPSVDYMFNSLSTIKNKKIIGILLTGMGEDGARGLLQIKQLGGTTIAESENTAIVFGMPKAAIKMGAAKKVLNLENIAGEILVTISKAAKKT